MVLHRDIYWVGRQWTVTGYGIQACDQKQKGKFDIESGRLWEDGVLEAMRELKWLNIEDFDKAVSVARKFYPEPGASSEEIVARPAQTVRDLQETSAKAASLIETSLKETSLKETSLKEISLKEKETSLKESPAEPKPRAQKFDMRVESWPARFAPVWRVRVRR